MCSFKNRSVKRGIIKLPFVFSLIGWMWHFCVQSIYSPRRNLGSSWSAQNCSWPSFKFIWQRSKSWLHKQDRSLKSFMFKPSLENSSLIYWIFFFNFKNQSFPMKMIYRILLHIAVLSGKKEVHLLKWTMY